MVQSQKKAVRIISKLKSRNSCRDAFRELGLLTLPCLYILDVALYCRFKCELVRGRDVHQYGTRCRDNLRLHPHRTAAFKRLPFEVGVKLINKLPDKIKNLNEPTKFKARLRHFLVLRVFYSVEEFMMSRWDEIYRPPPQVMTQNEVATRAGVLAHLMCNVTSDMAYNVSWYRLVSRTFTERRQPSLELVKESPQIRIHRNNSLILLSPQLSDEGWYICTAQNEGGKTSGRVYLLMQELPAVQITASQREFTSGSSVDIHCHVLAGIPYPSITWKKGNSIIQVLEERNYDSQWSVTLRNLQRNDEGVYSCEAKNAVGTDTGSVTLRFVEIPQVQAETDSLSVRQGTTALLNCLVYGTPSPRLSWLRDSTDLTQQLPRIQILENGTLEIQDTNEEDSGQYTCVARNKVGVARASIDLEVGSPPRIVHPPADLEVPIGKSGSMLCAATGTPVPRTTWTQHGQPLHNSRIFVSDPGELFIKDAQVEDEGNYTCTVENMFGKATYQIAVKVTGVVVPKLMAESLPSSTKALLGHTIQLPCPVLEGNPSPSRQWYKDGVLLEEASNSDGSLLLSNVTTEDAGQYQCVVSNVGGQDSISTTLNILVPPRILSEGGDMKAVEGSSLSLPCVTTGQPLPSVSWIWHGRRFQSEQEGSSLDLHNLTFLNSGTYTCLAISPAGTDSISVQLDVLVPPKISQWKENVTASEGQYTQLECHITANPPANISWYHEQRLLPYHSNIVRFAVNKTMEGQYKCVAENEVGSSTQLVNLFVPVKHHESMLVHQNDVGASAHLSPGDPLNFL
ncbi:Hemicentin-1 [Homalodisca vitripennis]|nr:Hemicentin-1 [Homalodisca vitripennis]